MNEPLKMRKKERDNRDYWNTQSLFNELHRWVPKRKFLQGEYTTGQVSEILHITSATAARYCEKGLFPGAWREESNHWWHISESALEAVVARIKSSDPEWTRRYWVRQASFGGPYEE
jgi:Helix-turn-helix domain